MNDSFLEDLGLIPQDRQKADRHITTRNPVTSSPLFRITQEDEAETLVSQTKSLNSPAVLHSPQSVQEINIVGLNPTKNLDHDTEKQATKTRTLDKKNRTVESMHKQQEAKVKIKSKERKSMDEAKLAQFETASKLVEKARVATRRSEGYKENKRSSDVSSKENSRPELSVENNLQASKDKPATGDSSGRKSIPKDKDAVVLLSAIKDIISTYTKQESTKILRALQELHINSQSNLIKHLLCQTDELVNEMHPSKNSVRLRALIEENERLRENITILQIRNEDMQKKLEDFELIKQENIALKLKCKELIRQ